MDHKTVGIGTQGVLITPVGDMPLYVSFIYDTTDQTAVSMVLTAEVELPCGDVVRDTQQWNFARKLIQDAFELPEAAAGLGDVKVTYKIHLDRIMIDLLDLEENRNSIYMDARPVWHFLNQTLNLVPSSAEYVDVDGAIETLLSGRHEL